MTLLPSGKDAVDGPRAEENLAFVEVLVGAKNGAIPRLQRLLEIPYSNCLTPALLRLHPQWDPLRGDPRFQKLCEEKKPWILPGQSGRDCLVGLHPRLAFQMHWITTALNPAAVADWRRHHGSLSEAQGEQCLPFAALVRYRFSIICSSWRNLTMLPLDSTPRKFTPG